MKVYILWYHENYDNTIIGVYDSLKKAQARKAMSDDWDQRGMTIEEVAVL